MRTGKDPLLADELRSHSTYHQRGRPQRCRTFGKGNPPPAGHSPRSDLGDFTGFSGMMNKTFMQALVAL